MKNNLCINTKIKSKTCIKCCVEKNIDDFVKNKANKDGCAGYCKLCRKNYNVEYKINNSNKIKKYNKEWQNKNPNKVNSNNKKFRDKNKDKIKKLRIKNKDKTKSYNKNYRESHKKERNIYFNERRKNDSVFKLKQDIRVSIRQSFKNRGVRKKCKTTEILGCSFDDFKTYLESKFEPWMTWNNHGNWSGVPKEKNVSWDIDHIIPLNEAKSETELIKLNHHTNLQPLCSYVNRYIKKYTY